MANAAQFDGATGYIQFATNLFGAVLVPITLECWAYQADTTQHGGLISTYGGPAATYTSGVAMGLGANSSATDAFAADGNYFDGVAVYREWVLSGASAPTGAWHHFALTLDNTNGWTFYIDGVATNKGGNGLNTNASAPPGYIGMSPLAEVTNFGGKIAYAACYKTALSAARISAHAGAASASAYVSAVLADTPALFYELQDASGSATVVDSSGNGNTGTVNGTVTFGVSGPFSSGGSTVSVSAANASTSGASGSAFAARSALGSIADTSGVSGAGAVARPVGGNAASDSAANASAFALRSIVASAVSTSASSGAASARRAGASTLTTDSSVAGLVAVIRAAVVSIASSTANAASVLVRRGVGTSLASVSTVSAMVSEVGSAVVEAAAIVSATTVSASQAVKRGVSAAMHVTSGASAIGVLRHVAAAVLTSISAIQAFTQIAGSTLVSSTTIAITLDMELSDTVVTDVGLSDTVQLAMPLEEA